MIIQITLATTIPSFLTKDVQDRLAYLDEAIETAKISTGGGAIDLTLRTQVEPEHEAAIRENIKRLIQSMCDRPFEPVLRVVEDHTASVPHKQNPMPELIARREAIQGGPGYFVFGPMISQLVAYIEARLLDVAAEMGAKPYRVPALIPPAYLQKCQYFKNFPHSLSFVTHLRSELGSIQRFSDQATTGESGTVAADNELYAPMRALLAPTVCHHIYFALSDSAIPEEGLVVTSSGHCFRYESFNMISLERLWNFTMREIIFIGSARHVEANLDEARVRVGAILRDLQLSHRVMTANDPFFIGSYRNATAYQNAFELKYEIRADLPYKQDSIAAGSFNRHENFFGRTLNIQLADGSPACTGCVGLGFERLAFAFIAQHGMDVESWPESVRNAMKPISRVRPQSVGATSSAE